MGLFDNDPKYQQLKKIREGSGYDGPLNQDGERNDPLDRQAIIVDDLRRRGAGSR